MDTPPFSSKRRRRSVDWVTPSSLRLLREVAPISRSATTADRRFRLRTEWMQHDRVAAASLDA